MANNTFPIFLAIASATFVFAIAAALIRLLDGRKRKLVERLATVAQASGGARALTITRNEDAVAGASRMLVRWRPMGGLHRLVVQAYPNLSVARFLCIAVGCAIVAFMCIAAATGNLVISAVAGVLGAYAPFLALIQRRARRQRALAMQLPEALDFLTRVLQAGHSFSTGMQMMSEDLPDPLKSEFRRCYEQHSLGQPLEDSLKEMSTRIGSTDFAFFVTAVLIQRQTGGDLGAVLRNISQMVRQRIRLAQHVKARTAEGRFTGYILVVFPAAMFLLVACLDPKYAHTLTGTSLGQKMLLAAFALEMMGLWMIRKLTTVRI